MHRLLTGKNILIGLGSAATIGTGYAYFKEKQRNEQANEIFQKNLSEKSIQGPPAPPRMTTMKTDDVSLIDSQRFSNVISLVVT